MPLCHELLNPVDLTYYYNDLGQGRSNFRINIVLQFGARRLLRYIGFTMLTDQHSDRRVVFRKSAEPRSCRR